MPAQNTMININGSGGSGSAAVITANRAAASDSSGNVVASSTTDTELGYVHGVTSALQTQLAAKLASPTWTTFTPTVTLVGGSGNTVPTYSSTLARYIQIGKFIHMQVALINTSGGTAGAGTGVLNVALPVAMSANTTTDALIITAGYMSNSTTEDFLLVRPVASSAALPLYRSVGFTAIVGNTQNNAARSLRFAFSYEID